MSSLFDNLESILSQTVSTATNAVSSATTAVSRGQSPMGALAGMLGMNLGGEQQQGNVPQSGQAPAAGNSALGPLSGLLGPAALGGLAGALLGGKGMRSMAGGALLASGGTYLWDKYKDQIKATYKELTAPDAIAADDGSAQGQVYDLDDSFNPIPAAAQAQIAEAPAESPLAASARAAAAEAAPAASAYAAAAPAASAHAAAAADAAPAASAHAAASADAAPAASAHAAAADAAPAASAHAAAAADAAPAASAHAATAATSTDAAPAASAHAAAAAEAAPEAHNPADLARRVVTALVFAAKADGHIDDAEQKAISDKMGELNLGPQTQELVQQAMNAPLDPALIADGVTDPELAMQLFMLSCSVIDVDHFMERSYLDALADALHIPKEMKAEMEEKIRSLKQEA